MRRVSNREIAMICPNLDHYVRAGISKNNDGNYFLPCCNFNMIALAALPKNEVRFSDYGQMVESPWLSSLRRDLADNNWPSVCSKCKNLESLHLPSPRLESIQYDLVQDKIDYLVANVMVDNICNGACQSCSPGLSSKLATLYGIEVAFLNKDAYSLLPHDRITRLYLLGGEPSYSKRLKQIMKELPVNLNSLWITTNGSAVIEEILLLDYNKINVQVNLSIDGIGKVFEYVRWPLSWQTTLDSIYEYKKVPAINLCMIVTVSALNVLYLDEIIEFSAKENISISWNVVQHPSELVISKKNSFTLAAKEKFKDSSNIELQRIMEITATGEDNVNEMATFIKTQDALRKISITNYLGDIHG